MISAEFDNAATAEAVRSVSNAHGLLEAFDAAAIRFGVRNERWLQRFAAADIPANFAIWARLKDLSLVPVKPHHRGPLGRALHDAGSILAKEASWALYALIVLGPIALVALAAFLLVRVGRRAADRRLLESS